MDAQRLTALSWIKFDILIRTNVNFDLPRQLQFDTANFECSRSFISVLSSSAAEQQISSTGTIFSLPDGMCAIICTCDLAYNILRKIWTILVFESWNKFFFSNNLAFTNWICSGNKCTHGCLIFHALNEANSANVLRKLIFCQVIVLNLFQSGI